MPEAIELNAIVHRLDHERLGELFSQLKIEVDDGWRASTARNIQPLIDALGQLDEEARNSVGALLEELALVGMKSRSIPLIRRFLEEHSFLLPDSLKSKGTAANLAAWTFTHVSDEQWRILKKRARVNNAPRGEWRYYKLSFGTMPDEQVFVTEKCNLEDAISSYIQLHEFRGYGCDSDIYHVDGVDYVLFRLSDYRRGDDEWQEDQQRFEPHEGSRGIPMAFSFDRETYRLGLMFNATSDECRNLAKVFADTAFGAQSYHRITSENYDLGQFKSRSSWPDFIQGGLKSVRLIGLDLWLDNSRRRKRTYFEEDADVLVRAREELGDAVLNDEDTVVKRAILRVSYDLPKRPDSSRAITVSEGALGGVEGAPGFLVAGIRNYLKNNGVLRDDGDQTADE